MTALTEAEDFSAEDGQALLPVRSSEDGGIQRGEGLLPPFAHGTTGTPRSAAFTGLRGIGCLLVVLGHSWTIVPTDTLERTGFLYGVFRSGSLGVTFFMVLGSFLVTRSLLREVSRRQTVNVPRFWVRRLVRVGSQLYPLLLVIWVVSRYDNFDPWSAEQTSRSLSGAATFTLNWGLTGDVLDYRADVGHLWYLCVEQQFYVVWILALAWFARFRVALMAFLGAAVVATLAWRLHVIAVDGEWSATPRTTTRGDGLLLGALAAMVFPYVRAWVALARRVSVPCLVALGYLVLRSPDLDPNAFLREQGIAFVAVSVVLVLAVAVADTPTNPGAWLLSRPPFVFVGRISYPLFLWHLPVFWASSRWATQVEWFPRALWTCVALGAIVFVTYRWIEVPTVRWLSLHVDRRPAPWRALPDWVRRRRRKRRTGRRDVDSTGRRTLPALDGLRGAACLLVVLLHAWLLVPIPEIEKTGPLLGLFKSGSLGVTLFFVVGSFLVTRSLTDEGDRTGSIRVDRFWMRRLIRLGSQLYPLLIVIGVVGWLDRWDTWSTDETQRSLATAATFTLNWSLVDDPGGLRDDVGHLWYLGVEQQFYFVWLFVLAWFSRFRVALMAMLAVGVVAIFVWRFHVIEEQGTWVAGWRTSTRADGLLLGALAALGYPFVRTWTAAARRITVPCLVTLAYLVYRSPTLDEYAFLKTQGIVFALVAALLVLGIAVQPGGPADRALSFAPLVFIGRISFPLYLWHYPVFWASSRWAREIDWIPRAVGSCAVLCGIVFVTYRWVERPVTSFLRGDRRQQGAVPPAATRAEVAAAAS